MRGDRFFSFHYERDAWRAGQVRNSWVERKTARVRAFWDAATWEEVQEEDRCRNREMDEARNWKGLR